MARTKFTDFLITKGWVPLLVLLGLSGNLNSSNLLEVAPLTDKVIMLYFDEGYMDYPDNLIVDRLDLAAADDKSSYFLTSYDDEDYSSSVIPSHTSRKSKGMEFVSNSGVPWAGNSFNPTGKPWASEHRVYLFLDSSLKPGHTYKLNTGSLADNGEEWTFTFDVEELRSEAVHINTLGYAPQAPKYGYVYQWMGRQGGLDLTDYQGNEFYLISLETNQSVFAGTMQKRTSADNPETGHDNDTPNRNFLGAEVYECDFSGFSASGEYKLVVEGIGCSYPFTIGDDPIWEAYYHGARSLYHQRSGIRLSPPYTQEGYIRPVTQNTKVTSDDGTDFSGQLLYCTLPWVEWDHGEGGGASIPAIRDASIGNALDVAGWYHDAGDWDSYAHHHKIPNMLMSVYEVVPERFMDGDLNIPESGNGIPDIVDEASWLVKFNYRLRKELMNKGYSDGGVGGARIAGDFFKGVDGDAERDKPSWKDFRRYVVTNADAYMTYMYASQAAQLAYVLKNLGKDPHGFPVEMLDHVELSQMTVDLVDWLQEAEEAWSWASDPDNQPSRHAHYRNELWVYKMNAAVQLYRLTGKEYYHQVALGGLDKLRSQPAVSDVESLGVYGYLLTQNFDIDKQLQADLESLVVRNAGFKALDAAQRRGLRWGGVYNMRMLVGHATTPWMFDAVMAYGITGNQEYADVVHTTADYFLGSNPLHTTWMTGVGPRPARGGFHLDSRYLWDENWKVYPGFVPYGPWTMANKYNPFTWTIDGVEMEGGAGPWNVHWANFSVYPFMEEWPGHERYNNNIHSPSATENTIHQQAVHVAITYGFVNNRHNTNASASVALGSIALDQTELTFNASGEDAVLVATLDRDDASMATLKWSSSDPRVAHVDGYGRVTAVTAGTAVITCSTLDGSVFVTSNVNCNWEDTSVNSITISPANYTLVEGEKRLLSIEFDPADATNQLVNWSFDSDGIVNIDDSNYLTALKPGNVTATATTVKDSKTFQIDVEVLEKADYVIADFDVVKPVTNSPQPDASQLYTPGGGTSDIAAANPLKGLANSSDLVFKYGRPSGEWRLFGMVLPTNEPQVLSRYSQFQFKYFGKGIFDFRLVLQTEEEIEIEFMQAVSGEDCWQLFTYDLDSDLHLTQFNVFVNQTNLASGTFYFDDFILSAEHSTPFNDLAISLSHLDLDLFESKTLEAYNQGEPFTWVSSDPSVASIDQEGKVTAISEGTATIKAVALNGNVAECTVMVDGGSSDPEPGSNMILDFEEYELDWNPYAAISWNSNNRGIVDNPSPSGINTSDRVFWWERDGTGNWGGFMVIFPMELVGSAESLVFDIYVDQPLNDLAFELRNGPDNEDKIFETTLSALGIQANTWTQVVVDISELAPEQDFDRVGLLPYGGTNTVVDVYFDNFILGKEEVTNSINNYVSASELTIYPNPTSGSFTVQSKSLITSVEIINPDGMVLFSYRDVGTDVFFINETGFNNGVYFVKVVTAEDGTQIEKLIVR